jgi:hypothetical protein
VKSLSTAETAVLIAAKAVAIYGEAIGSELASSAAIPGLILSRVSHESSLDEGGIVYQRFFDLIILVLAVLLATPAIYGQVDVSTATLKGTVLDQTAAAVPGATVTVANAERGFTKTVTTGDDGTYLFPLLQPGAYRMEVAMEGFDKAVANSVELTIGASVVFDIHLKVGSVKDVMNVTEAAPLIETEKTQQANTLGTTTIDNLPNLTRNFTDSVFTLPGVSNSDAPRLQNPGYTGFLTSGFSIGGSNGRNNLVTFDGGENDYGSGQLRTPNVSVDSVQEFQVNRSAFAGIKTPELGTSSMPSLPDRSIRISRPEVPSADPSKRTNSSSSPRTSFAKWTHRASRIIWILRRRWESTEILPSSVT